MTLAALFCDKLSPTHALTVKGQGKMEKGDNGANDSTRKGSLVLN